MTRALYTLTPSHRTAVSKRRRLVWKTPSGGLFPYFIAIFVLSIFATIVVGHPTDNDGRDPPSVVLEWGAPHSQDMLSGEWLFADDRTITLRSRLFQQPVTIDRNAIQAIQLGLNKHSNEESTAKDLILLKDGSRLRGTAGEYGPNDANIPFVDELAGKMLIPKNVIERSEKLASTLYDWNGLAENWQNPKTNEKSDWEVNKQGNWVGSKAGATAWMPLSRPGSFAANVVLSGSSRPEFGLAFGKDPERSLRIAMVGNSLIAGTSTDFEVIKDLDNKEWKIVLRLEWDASVRSWSVWDGTNPAVSPIVVTSKANEELSGVLLWNESGSTVLESLSVFGSIEAGREGIKQASASTDPMKPLSEGERIRGWNGTILVGKLRQLRNGIVEWSMPSLGENKVSFPIDQVSRVEWKNAGVVGQPEYELILGQNKLRGSLGFGSGEKPLLWKTLGQNDFVALQTEFPYTIRRKLGANKIPVGSYVDLAFARNGDVLPVSFKKFDSTHAEFLIPFSREPKKIPSERLLAIEMERHGKRLKHTFTKESRDQLLSIPRGSDLSLFPHALIGSNGDLLRGVLQSVTASGIEMEVKMEPCLIGRESIAAIVFLSEEETTKEAPADKGNAIEESLRDRLLESGQKSSQREGQGAFPWVRLTLKDDYLLTVQILKEEVDSIVCLSEWLGEFTIPKDLIDSVVGVNVDFSSSVAYASWRTRSLIAPQWKESDTPQPEGQSLVGSVAESFELAGLSGKPFRSSEHSGKILVVDFWATWCGPCVKLLPEYVDVLKEYAESDVYFLGINSSESPEVVRDFMNKQKLSPFETAFDYDGSVSNRFLVTGIPHTVVIGPTGVVEYVHIGYSKTAAAKLKATIDKLLEKK